jgi:hypothetical protein
MRPDCIGEAGPAALQPSVVSELISIGGIGEAEISKMWSVIQGFFKNQVIDEYLDF